jgi:hypothetical protein
MSFPVYSLLFGWPPVNRQVAYNDLFGTGDHAKDRLLSAAGQADQVDEFLFQHIQVDPVDNLNCAMGFDDALKTDAGIWLLPYMRRLFPPHLNRATDSSQLFV